MKQNKSVGIAVALSVSGCLAMVAFPQLSLIAAQKGLNLWAGTVVPAMLPFFICAGLMMRLGVPHHMAGYFEKPVRKYFRVPGVAAFSFLMSISSGYPMGARIIGDLREKKQIGKWEAERMLCFCSTSGPLFMLGAVGAGMLGSMAAGWVIAISHYTSAILNGMLFRYHGKRQGCAGAQEWDTRTDRDANPYHNPGIPGLREQESVVAMLTDAIFSAMRTLLLIGGYIVIFMMLVAFLEAFSFFDLFPHEAVKSLAKGAFEFTVGCEDVSAGTLDMLTKCVICSTLISWGGLSTHFQIASILGKTDVSMFFYIRAKICHAGLAAMVSFGIGGALLRMAGSSAQAGLFGMDITGAGALTAQIATIGQEAEQNFFETVWVVINNFLFSSQMIIMLIVMFAVISVLGRMSYQIHTWIRKWWIRRKNARRKAREADTAGL